MAEESTNARIFESLDSIKTDIATVRTDVAVIKASSPTVQTTLADHERRLRALETRVWLAVGGFGLIAAASPWLLAYIYP